MPRPRIAPGALHDLKALLHQLYAQAGTPPCDEIARQAAEVAEAEGWWGAPSGDTVLRILRDPVLPPSQADAVAVALARRAGGWDASGPTGGDIGARIRQLWAQARVQPVEALRTIGEWDPIRLGVHRAIAAGNAAVAAPVADLTAYFVRRHDTELRDRLTDASAGAAVFVVLTGASSTGKTRALYEAVTAVLPTWSVLAPSSERMLVEWIERDGIDPCTVLWLNETQRFLPAAGGALAGLLERVRPLAVVGAIWDEYWNPLTYPVLPDQADADAREHTRGLVEAYAPQIPVREELDPQQMDEFGALCASDARLRAAYQAGGADGRVIQHLTGGPELVQRFEAGAGPVFTPLEHAVITAALDARRLGHTSPLPTVLLAEAASGYLSSRERASADPAWIETVLTGICEDERTRVKGALTALTQVRVAGGIGPADGCDPADYLDQHARRSRRHQFGAPELWQSLTAHAAGKDLYGLSRAAYARGVYKHAVTLWRKAVELHGERVRSEDFLLEAARRADPDAEQEIAAWQERFLDERPRRLHDDSAVSLLLERLPDVADSELLSELAHLPLSYSDMQADTLLCTPEGLLLVLERHGRSAAAGFLAHRIASEGSLAVYLGRDFPSYRIQYVGNFLQLIRRTGTAADLSAVMTRLSREADVRSPWHARFVVEALWNSGGRRQALEFAERVAVGADITDDEVLPLLIAFRTMELDGPWAILASRTAHSMKISTWNMGKYVAEFTPRGDDDIVGVLIQRILEYARQRPSGVLYSILQGHDAQTAEHARVAAVNTALQAPIDDAASLTALIRELRVGGMSDAIQVLSDRDIGAHLTLEAGTRIAAGLLEQLRLAGLEGAIERLFARGLIDHIGLNEGPAYDIARLFDQLGAYGSPEPLAALSDRVARQLDTRSISRLAAALDRLRVLGQEHAFRELTSRVSPEADFQSEDLRLGWGIEALLRTLIAAEAAQTIAMLAEPIAQGIGLDSPATIARVAILLAEAGHRDAALALARRASRDMDLDDPEVFEDTAVIDDWHDELETLTEAFDQIGAHEARIEVLLRRVSLGSGSWEKYAAAVAANSAQEQSLVRFGHDGSGTAQAWTWAETAPA